MHCSLSSILDSCLQQKVMIFSQSLASVAGGFCLSCSEMNDESARRMVLKEQETYFFARALFPRFFRSLFPYAKQTASYAG